MEIFAVVLIIFAALIIPFWIIHFLVGHRFFPPLYRDPAAITVGSFAIYYEDGVKSVMLHENYN